jgi:hypothetical protein
MKEVNNAYVISDMWGVGMLMALRVKYDGVCCIMAGPQEHSSRGHLQASPLRPLFSVGKRRNAHARCKWREAVKEWNQETPQGLGETEKVIRIE